MEDKTQTGRLGSGIHLSNQPKEDGLVQIQRSPHIPRPIDNTALNDYMTCPRKFFYGKVLNRRRSGPPSPAIAFGSSWHAAMEAHYTTGGDQDAVARAVVQSWRQHDRAEDHRTIDRVLAAYREYLSVYGDHDKEVTTQGNTVGFDVGQPMIEIPVEIGWPGSLHPYTGRIDRIIEWRGLFYVEDHKTTSQMGSYYFDQFDPNNQMMGYAWLAQQVTGLSIAGVRINALACLKTQNKFARQIISYSKERLAEWAENYNAWVQRLESSYQCWSAFEQGTDDGADYVEAEGRSWPMNLMACAGKYGQCQYTNVCTMPPRRRLQVLEMDYTDAPWQPLAVLDGEAE